MQVSGANPVSITSFQSYGSADATITISEPFDGSRTISYYYDEIGVPKSGSKPSPARPTRVTPSTPRA
jgi:hypothetical protein